MDWGLFRAADFRYYAVSLELRAQLFECELRIDATAFL